MGVSPHDMIALTDALVKSCGAWGAAPGRQVTVEEQIAQLEERLAELKARLPKHSVSAAMMIELEELEEEIEGLRARDARERDTELDV
jgi:hypothetical protein